MKDIRNISYETLAYDIAIDLELTNKLPLFRLVDEHDDGAIGKRLILKDDELVSVAVNTCLKKGFSPDQAIRHEFYHVYQRRQEKLSEILSYWDSLIAKYPIGHNVYKLSALELSAHVYAYTADTIEAARVFDSHFPSLGVLRRLSDRQVQMLGYAVFQELASTNKLHPYVCQYYSKIKIT